MTRTDQNNVVIDGIDNGSRAGSGPSGFEPQASRPSVDAVGELRVVTNNMSGERGFRMGSKLLVSIKCSSYELHGSFFEFIRNEKLDATHLFANRSGSVNPTLRQNKFGGTIVKKLTLGFFSYLGTRTRLGRSLLATVPAHLARNGDFSIERRNFSMILDPATIVGTGADAVQRACPRAPESSPLSWTGSPPLSRFQAMPSATAPIMSIACPARTGCDDP